MATQYSTTAYPYDCVCYIVVTYPDGESYQGSGVIVGAHTVLTASHLLWDADNGEAASSVTVYAGYDRGGTAITGQWTEHLNEIDDKGGTETQATSQSDFAVIDFSTDLSSYGSFSIGTDYAGGVVHMTGYPAKYNGEQVDQTGTVYADQHYDTLDYGSISPSPGNSGGPLWVEEGSTPTVVGLVSTSGWGVELTDADVAAIDSWETADSYLWTGAATVLAAGQALPAADGGSGADTLIGYSGPDTLFGGGGDDSIVGGAGFNQVNGNTGDDVIVGRSAVGDWLLGGQGNDSIDASGSTGANILNGNLGADTLTAGSGADSLRGGQGDDVIHAGSGADWISGDLGSNTIYGGAGADMFHAGGGHDYVEGWHAGDRVQVDAGVNFAVAQVGADVHVTFSNGGEMDLLNTQVSALQAGWITN